MKEAIEEASLLEPAAVEQESPKKKKKKDKKRKSQAMENGEMNGTMDSVKNGDNVEVNGDEDETPKKKKKKKKSKSVAEDEWVIG